MLPAKPNALVTAWFDAWCRRALRGHFNRVHLVCEDRAGWERVDPALPRLYVGNHSSFWDGIVLFHLLRQRIRQPLYCMVDAEQVAEHPFFRRVGCFSIDRTSPRDRALAVRHAADLLAHRRPAPAVVIFPQGQIRPNDARPLSLEPGFAHVIDRIPSVRVVPVALRYEFWIEQRAEAMVHMGQEFECQKGDRAGTTARVERAIERGLAELTRRGRQFEPGEVALMGKPSISRWKDRVR